MLGTNPHQYDSKPFTESERYWHTHDLGTMETRVLPEVPRRFPPPLPRARQPWTWPDPRDCWHWFCWLVGKLALWAFVLAIAVVISAVFIAILFSLPASPVAMLTVAVVILALRK